MTDTEELRQRAEQFNHQLLTSEDQYVNELETIVNYIVKPLEKAAVRCKISGGEDSVKKVFKYLNSMLQFHVTFLSVIRETISIIPDLYKYIGFITMYDDYLHNYDKIIHIFSTWRSMEFREFITMRLKHKNVKKNIIDRLDSLPWYLYRPFDRIKEYHRFLKDIEKITNKTHDNYAFVNKTLIKIRPLYKKIKSHENRLQQKTRLLEVQLQIHGYNKPLVEDDRFFVYNRQCQMKRRGLPGKKYKHIQIYLFNDLFLWVSARGRFKGSYSFYKENLEIFVPPHSKKGDAIFSIGLKTEKHKRLIICADDMQRDKLMNTVLKTYKQCQQKYIKTLNGSDTDLIKQMKKKQVRETMDNEMEFSDSSMMSYNFTNNNKYKQEYSISETDKTDVTDITFNYKNHKKRYTNHLPINSPGAGGLPSVVGVVGVSESMSRSVDDDVKISLHHSDRDNITPEPSIEATVDLNGEVYSPLATNKQSKPDTPVIHRHRSHSHRHHHKSRKREQIKELENELKAMRKELGMKDDRIRDLEESNKTIRQTLRLKNIQIESLQDKVQHLSKKMGKHSHNMRAKSMSGRIRPERVKRASSFSIGKGGKITRTVMLPSQINHNKKILKLKQKEIAQNGGSQSCQTPIFNNGLKKYHIQSVSKLHTPHAGLQRSHSENSNSRKVKSEKYYIYDK